MDQAVLFTAVTEAARKRRILGAGAATRLAGHLAQKGLSSLTDLRRWLALADGSISTPLANRLAELLPKEDELPYGAYVPLAHLADGGMGTVWLACSPKNEMVVVKTLKSNLTVQPGSTTATEFMRRFDRETKITMQLDHPSVVRCLDSGVRTDGTAFMVLEYVDSGDLKELVDSRAGLSEGLALAIVYQAVDALQEAHRIRLVHRDIKPANIFVSSTGQAKLADFGIARSTEDSRTMLTMQGALVGSPMYMSPEQVLSDPNLDIRSDIYAMGCVLYYSIAAQAPYDGRIQEVLHKHCTATIPDVRKLRPKISERTHQIIVGCLQKERDKRYRDPSHLLGDLADALVRLGLNPGKIEEETRHGDLSDNESGFKPAAVTITQDLNIEATIAADLSGEGTMATRIEEPQTIVANLLAEGVMTHVGYAPSGDSKPQRTAIGAQAPAPVSNSDTAVTMAAVGMPGTPVDGDFTTALADDFIVLAPTVAGDGAQVMLFAKPTITLGKLRESPVDVVIRNYPVEQHKDSITRVSRQHVTLRYRPVEGTIEAEDLGAANGTMLDGIQLNKGSAAALEAGRDNILVLGGVAVLWIKPIKRASPVVRDLPNAPPTQGQPDLGLDAPCNLDALVMSRPENRSEMAYALVLRRLTIGGPGAELVCGGARTHAAIEVARYGGRWLWRVAGQVQSWRPLCTGTEVDVAGHRLVAQAGAFSHFD